MKIQCFIFNWKGQYENALKLEKELKNYVDVIVVNSDDEHKLEHWKNIGDEYYFSAQFRVALNLFDPKKYDCFWHIQSDASSDQFKQIIDSAKNSFEKYKWGVYAPNVDDTFYIPSRTDIIDIENGLKLVATTDNTCWFIHKDFMDLMGRLRGSAEYIGNDPTMPKVGPRWIILTSNPTRNWVYRKLVKPLHDYKKGVFNPDLLCQVDNNGKPILVDNKPIPIIELFEGSTHENIENVGEDFISGMLATFTNDSMRKRFIFGEWGALSGLVYNVFNEAIHELPHGTIIQYLTELRYSGYKPTFFEGYDHGLIRPSCYGLFFADDDRNVFLLDGFYSKEQTIDTSCELIKQIREDYGVSESNEIFADPQLFRRSPGSTGVVGVTVAELFARNGIRLIRGNRDIPTGIAKNIQYLTPVELHEHPITGAPNAPHFFVSDKCDWFVSEINEWMYKADTSGEVSDTTSDKNDHAMDMWKYAMTHTPKLASYVGKRTDPPPYLYWHEIESANNQHKVLPRHRA